MKLLLDQDVYDITLQFLRGMGLEVATAAELGCSRSADTELLRISMEQDYIFITRDKDFGALVFLEELGKGVIYLRMIPSNIQAVHEELKTVLTLYSNEQLKEAFIVIEASRHRIRKPHS